MKNMRVARRYAGALMEAAEDAKSVDTTAADLDVVGAVLRESRELRLLTLSPVVSPAKKTAVFHAVFGPRIGKGTMDFIDLVVAKKREAHLAEIIDQFSLLRDE